MSYSVSLSSYTTSVCVIVCIFVKLFMLVTLGLLEAVAVH